MFAFLGLEVALVPSGEIPRRVAHGARERCSSASAITTLVYVLVQAVAQGVLGDLAGDVFGRAAGRSRRSPLRAVSAVRWCSLGTAVSMLGYLSGDMLGTPRTLFALGRARDPAAARRPHPPPIL